MNLLLRLKNKLIGKEEKSVEDAYVKAMYIVMRKMHLSYQELMKLPLPTFIELLKELGEEEKKQPGKKQGMQKGKK